MMVINPLFIIRLCHNPDRLQVHNHVLTLNIVVLDHTDKLTLSSGLQLELDLSL